MKALTPEQRSYLRALVSPGDTYIGVLDADGEALRDGLIARGCIAVRVFGEEIVNGEPCDFCYAEPTALGRLAARMPVPS